MNELITLLKKAWTSLNDRILNISTISFAPKNDFTETGSASWKGPEIDTAQFKDNVSYSSADYFYTYKLRRILNPEENDIFYDIGCGKGRVLCIFARKRIKKCVGIEVIRQLCEDAEKNAKKLRKRRSEITIIYGDASRYDISDGTIYYMFNPFGQKTMEKVIQNIEKSLKDNPRMIQIAYHNAECEGILDKCNWLERYYSSKTVNGLNIICWRSKPDELH